RQDHHSHELGRDRRAHLCEPRHQDSDPPRASAGAFRVDQRHGQGQRSHLPLGRSRADFQGQRSGSCRQARAERRHRWSEGEKDAKRRAASGTAGARDGRRHGPSGVAAMIKYPNLGLTARLRLGLAAIAMTSLLFATPLAAQTLTNSFGGLSKNSNEPIDIESDVLVVHDQQKYATFTGNVKAVQGTTTLRAEQLDVHYVGGGDKLATGETKPAPAEGPAPAGDKPADASQGQQAQI